MSVDRVNRVVALLGVLLLAGCGGAPSRPASGSASPPAPSASPGPVGSSPAPSAPPSAGGGAASGEPSPEPPPEAFLVVAGVRIRGTIGGYTWGRFADSAPWLPASALEPVAAPGGARLSVTFDDRASIASWAARMAPATDTSGSHPIGLGEGTADVVFSGPSSGSWVVSVAIRYAGDLGDGAYYWRLDVP